MYHLNDFHRFFPFTNNCFNFLTLGQGKPLRELLQDVRVKQAAFTKETIKTELKGKINLTENSPFSTALVKVYAH